MSAKNCSLCCKKNAPQQPQIYCVNDQQVMSYSTTENEVALQTISSEIEEYSEMLQNQYLYEPNASQMKAGALLFCRKNMALRHFLLIVTSSFRPISSRIGMVESSRYKPFRV